MLKKTLKKRYSLLKLIVLMLLLQTVLFTGIDVHASNKKFYPEGKIYSLEKDGSYDLSSAKTINEVGKRILVNADISNTSQKNGFTCYGINGSTLKISIDTSYKENLINPSKKTDWYIINDKSKKLNGTTLSDKIGTGAILVQTSRDGHAWINIKEETDIYNKLSSINSPTVYGEKKDSFYEATNIQLANGCYYRIVVAYKLERETGSNQFLFINTTSKEQCEQIETYQFYAYDNTVNQSEVLNLKNSYEFNKLFRVDSPDGFKGQEAVDANDPHNDWTIGTFYVSGWTDYNMDGDTPTFLKVPGDRVALWFNLKHSLDKCNNNPSIKVYNTPSGSDISFGTPTIDNFGHGTLIIKKTDKSNKEERQIYTNYLEAAASPSANIRVDLFEEGDYEGTLDYQIRWDKDFVFGTTTKKTLTYKMPFKFKIRNGDISSFIRDVSTDKFITNANVAEQGFYIDVANSQYLKIYITREVLTDSLDGLMQDTKFSSVGQEGVNYTDEGIYTIKVTNTETNVSVDKRVYVGNRDLLIAHMNTGLPLGIINEKLAAGAYIDESGNIIENDYNTENNNDNIEELYIDDEDNETESSVSEENILPETNTHSNDSSFIGYLLIICIVIAFIGFRFYSKKSNKKEP